MSTVRVPLKRYGPIFDLSLASHFYYIILVFECQHFYFILLIFFILALAHLECLMYNIGVIYDNVSLGE
jgi:hypothetical protein